MSIDELEQHPVRLSFLFERKRIGTGGGGHAPEADGAAGDSDFDLTSDGRNRAAEGVCDDPGGLLSGGDKGAALRDSGHQ